MEQQAVLIVEQLEEKLPEAENLAVEMDEDEVAIKEKKNELRNLIVEIDNLKDQIGILSGVELVTSAPAQLNAQSATPATITFQAEDGVGETGETDIAQALDEMIGSLTNLKVELEERLEELQQLRDEKARLEQEIQEKEDELQALEDELAEQQQINVETAQYVIDLIEALPEDITYNDKTSIEEARKEYNALTRSQKKLVREDCYGKLLQAEESLAEIPEPAADKSQLQAKLAEASQLIESDYTASTWTTLQDAITVAEYTMADEDATETSVANALNNLIVALKGLEIKDDPTEEEANNYKVAHSKALSLTVAEVGLADETIIVAALDAFRGLSSPAQAILTTKKTLLDNLLQKINELKQEALEQAAVNAVMEQIASLPLPTKITLSDKDAVEEARRLYDCLKEDLKGLVTNIGDLEAAENRITELEEEYEADQKAYNFKQTYTDVLALTVQTVEITDYQGVIAALEAFELLQETVKDKLATEKALLDALLVSISDLKQAVIDQAAADEVVQRINVLPDFEVLDLDDQDIVAEALAAYDALTSTQKNLVPEEALAILESAVEKIADLEEQYETDQAAIGHVIDLIAGLPAIEEITLEDQGDVETARRAYDELDEHLQGKVTNVDVLEAAEGKIAELEADEEASKAAETFKDEVSTALSLKIDAVEIDEKHIVEAALALFEHLPDTVKPKLEDEKYLLDALLSQIELLEEVDQEAADNVSELVDSLPAIDDLTLENKADVERARKACDKLTERQLGLLTEGSLAVLEASEERIAQLEADKAATEEAHTFTETYAITLGLDAETVAINDREDIEEAIGAYGALSQMAQDKLQDELALLQELLQKIEALEQQAAEDLAAAEIVEDMINDLPRINALVLADKEVITNARAAYEDLTDVQKALVTNLEALETVEAKMVELEKTVDQVGDEAHDGYYAVNRAYTDNTVKTSDIGTVTLKIGDKNVTDDFDITFYDAEDGNEIATFDLSNGGTTFKTYMVARAKAGKDYYDVAAHVIFKYGSVTIGNNEDYYTIEDALGTAKANDIVYVKYNTSFAEPELAGFVYGETQFNVPSGVTLLLPYSEAFSKSIDDNPGRGNTGKAITRNSAYAELTLPAGVELQVQGTLTVNAMRAAYGTKYSGHVTTTNYSQLCLNENSKITVASGGTLSAMGFIYGEGQVEALQGSTVNDSLFNQSFRGGTATSKVQSDVFPFDQFTINNIESRLVINSGALYYARAQIFVSSAYYSGDLKLVGTDNKSLIQLTSGQLIKTYDPASAIVTMDFHGDAKINVSSINVSGITANSNGKDMPFDGTWKFNFAAGSNIVIDSWMVLLPGAQMDIAEGANVTITENGRLGVFNPYEHLDDYNTYPVTTKSNKNVEDYYRVAPVFNYDANTPAILTINGALNVEGGLAGRVHKTNTGTLTWGDTIYKTYDYKYVIGSAGDAKSNSRELTFWEEGESTLAVVATPSTVVTKDKTVSTIVATVKDGSNNPIQKINLTFSGGKGTWSATSGTSDNDGKVTVTYTTSEDEDEGTSLTVTEASGNKTAKVNLNVKKSSGGGSCPFVYSHDGEEYHFEHESFPFAVNSALETASYGTLRKLQKVNGKYQVKVAERLDEKSYLNGFKLLAVDYPAGEGIGEVFADIFGRPHTIIERILPIEFVDSDGNSWLSEIKTKDQLIGSRQEGLNEGRYITSYIASYDKPQDAGNMAKLMVRTQKSPLITQSWAWFLDKLDSVNNMWWMEKVMELPENYDKFIDFIDMVNLRVELWDGEEWVEQGQIKAGRHLLEEFLIPLDISGISSKAGEIKVRLTFGTGLYEIDQISIDFSEDQIANIVELEPDKALFNGERDIKDVISNFDDCDRIKMLTGDEIDLFYDVPELNDGHERGFTVAIKGYYHMDADGKEKPIPSEWSDIGTDGIIEALYKIGDEDAIKAMPAFEWMTGLIESLYGAPMEEKIEKTIVDNVLPWLNEKK